MAIPKKIRINREPDYHTHYIGKFANKCMFMGFVIPVFPLDRSGNWKPNSRWYAVLHKFDEDGNHTGTEVWFAGLSADGEEAVTQKAQEKLETMIEALGKHRFCNIRVKLFSTMFDGVEFGLIPNVNDEDGTEEVTLLPNELVFFDPWDGFYDT